MPKNNQKIWTAKDTQILMEFIGEVAPKEVGKHFEFYAQEHGRTANATQYHYYTYRKEYFSNKNNPQPEKQTNMAQITTDKGARYHKGWSADDIRNLNDYIAQGKGPKEISELLHRPPAAISSKLYRIEADKKAKEAKTKTTRLSADDWAISNGYVKADSVPVQVEVVKEQAIIPGPTLTLLKGKQIRVPIIDMFVDNNELVIQF